MTAINIAPTDTDANASRRTFEAFVDGAVRSARSPSHGSAVTLSHPLLNGVPYATFRRQIDIDIRRQIGAFFSGGLIANDLASLIKDHVNEDALVVDPTCGIGDLLLARAACLPLGPTLRSTVLAWGGRLGGFDTRADLVRLCKARLCMMARARGGFIDEIDPLTAFPHIVERDMMAPESDELLGMADAILFNPPFGKTTWAKKLDWATGEINAAAIFLDRLTSAVQPNAVIAAILPEVLRCGSRYERFRKTLSERGYAGSFDVRGRFDAWTDVDVFMTYLRHSEIKRPIWRREAAPVGGTVQDRFEVRVGTVVPHRDLEAGETRAYICAKTTPAWQTDFTPRTHRRHRGRVFSPPFVAIRRTSSPSDKSRAVATVVTGDEPVAVENHLLVARPLDGKLASCRALVVALRSDQTNSRLNDLMRCRHLTTGAIKALPWNVPDE